MFTEVTMFEVPEFRRNAQLFKTFSENISDEKLGSQRWIELMSEKIPVQGFTDHEVPVDFRDFIQIVNFSHFIGDVNPTAVYIYGHLFKEYIFGFLEGSLCHGVNIDDDFLKELDDDNYIIQNKEEVIKVAKRMLGMNLQYNYQLINFVKLLENTFFYEFGCSICAEEGSFNIELHIKSGGVSTRVCFSKYDFWRNFHDKIKGINVFDEFSVSCGYNAFYTFGNQKMDFSLSDDSGLSITVELIVNELNMNHILRQLQIIDEDCNGFRNYDKLVGTAIENSQDHRIIPKYVQKSRNFVAPDDYQQLQANASNLPNFLEPPQANANNLPNLFGQMQID